MPFQSFVISAFGSSSCEGSDRNTVKLFMALSLVFLSCYTALIQQKETVNACNAYQ